MLNSLARAMYTQMLCDFHFPSEIRARDFKINLLRARERDSRETELFKTRMLKSTSYNQLREHQCRNSLLIMEYTGPTASYMMS